MMFTSSSYNDFSVQSQDTGVKVEHIQTPDLLTTVHIIIVYISTQANTKLKLQNNDLPK